MKYGFYYETEEERERIAIIDLQLNFTEKDFERAVEYANSREMIEFEITEDDYFDVEEEEMPF